MKGRVESLIVEENVDCYDDNEEFVVVYDPQGRAYREFHRRNRDGFDEVVPHVEDVRIIAIRVRLS